MLVKHGGLERSRTRDLTGRDDITAESQLDPGERKAKTRLGEAKIGRTVFDGGGSDLHNVRRGATAEVESSGLYLVSAHDRINTA